MNTSLNFFSTLSFSSREAIKNPHKRKEMAFFAKINHPTRNPSKRINPFTFYYKTGNRGEVLGRGDPGRADQNYHDDFTAQYHQPVWFLLVD